MFEKLLVNEYIAEFTVFNFRALDSAWLDITEFIANGLFRFCLYQYDYFPELIYEFYANLYVDEIDEAFDDYVLKSKVNGVEIYVDEKQLSRLFEMNNGGRKCTKAKFSRNEGGETMEIHYKHQA